MSHASQSKNNALLLTKARDCVRGLSKNSTTTDDDFEVHQEVFFKPYPTKLLIICSKFIGYGATKCTFTLMDKNSGEFYGTAYSSGLINASTLNKEIK